MKKCFKILLTLCLIFVMFSFSVYAEETKPFEYNDEQLIKTVEGIFTEINGFEEYELKYYAENSLGITKTVCEEYMRMREQDTLGEFIKFKDSKIENKDSAAVVTVVAEYEKTELTIAASYMKIGSGADASIVPVDISMTVGNEMEEMSKGEALKNAALNTLMGITIVVLMLTLISFIISLFKYIPKIQEKFAGRKQKSKAFEAELSADNVISQISEKEEIIGDTELAAVITAAICAATGASSDSFVVRSIKKNRFRK